MTKNSDTTNKITKSESQWREELEAESYHVLREKGTEPAFSGKYWNLKDQGMYHCGACGVTLFSSEAKYDSESGWPSFYGPSSENDITEKADYSHGMIRTEVVCRKCDSHLGHVFPDGPAESGLRYCINSTSLVFQKKE